jgi:hypothetical protein
MHFDLRRYTKAKAIPATDQGATAAAAGTSSVRATGSGAGWLTQFALLLTRAHKSQRRDVVGVGVTVFLDVFYALLLSALFRGVTDDQAGWRV